MARFVLTHLWPRGADVAAFLHALGHDVVPLPFARLEALHGAAGSLAALDIRAYDQVIVTSPSAAEFAAQARPGPWTDVKLAAVGPGTGRALVDVGMIAPTDAVEMPDGDAYDADALLRRPSLRQGDGRRLLVVCGAEGRRDWQATLAGRGFRVDRLALYRREAAAPDASAWRRVGDWAATGAGATFVVTTRSTIAPLVDALRRLELSTWAFGCAAVCPHARIAAVLREAGWPDVRTPNAGQRLVEAAIESGEPPPEAGTDERTDADCP